MLYIEFPGSNAAMKWLICVPIQKGDFIDFQSSPAQNPSNSWFSRPVQSKSIWPDWIFSPADWSRPFAPIALQGHSQCSPCTALWRGWMVMDLRRLSLKDEKSWHLLMSLLSWTMRHNYFTPIIDSFTGNYFWKFGVSRNFWGKFKFLHSLKCKNVDTLRVSFDRVMYKLWTFVYTNV